MNYYRYEPHSHTSEVSPCGKVQARDMVELYKKAGYQGLIITDHYCDYVVEDVDPGWDKVADHFLSGYRKALLAGKELGLDIILGMELRFNGANEDYLVYGFDEEFIYKHPYLNHLTLASFRQLINDRDILIFQAHPFRRGLVTADSGLIHGVEAFNGNPRHNSYNDKAFSYGINNGLYLISGSDAHQVEDIGRGGIGLTERIASSRELVAWIKSDKPMDLIHKA